MSSQIASAHDRCDEEEYYTKVFRFCAIVLHLQDRFKSGPTWSMHESGAELGVFLNCGFAEEIEFVLKKMC